MYENIIVYQIENIVETSIFQKIKIWCQYGNFENVFFDAPKLENVP